MADRFIRTTAARSRRPAPPQKHRTVLADRILRAAAMPTRQWAVIDSNVLIAANGKSDQADDASTSCWKSAPRPRSPWTTATRSWGALPRQHKALTVLHSVSEPSLDWYFLNASLSCPTKKVAS